MINVYRIVKARYSRSAFSGYGARIAGGRWNEPGFAIVYTSGSLALAAMETFVHLGEEGLALRFVYVRAMVPDSVTIERCTKPPARWRSEPPSLDSMRYGTAWVKRASSAVLEVPSAMVPTEPNFLLNPAHPDFATIEFERARPFQFDPRLWK